ncbi:hypothetical protein BKN14_05690 [Candidatus Gracilibacteria bacterium HOT-871]|nr:hypothetical protein BKN14_05690 [Candidatus Gracilibacteria bacterium HOT-871]
MKKIFVNLKQIGKKYPIVEKQEIFLNTEENEVSLEQFLNLIVENQVEEFNKKSFEDDSVDYLKSPNFTYLNTLTNTGKAGFGAIYNKNKADLEKAKEVAILGFKDGLFVVFDGEDEILDLSEKINLSEEKIFTFIRLTFLAGSIW